MPRTSTFPLYDRLAGGGLLEQLQEWRSEGDSYETLAYKLRAEHGIVVTASTVFRWMQPETAA